MYPYHIGRQKGSLKSLQPTGLTLNRTLLSEKLKSLGYKTHLVGKWHLGFCNKKYTPTKRGFDSFKGFYTGSVNPLNHTNKNGFDYRSNLKVNKLAKGHYSTDLITKHSINALRKHSEKNLSAPLFLYISYFAVHAPIMATLSEYKKVARTDKIVAGTNGTQNGEIARDIYRAMLSKLDKGVNRIIQKLKTSDMWKDTILVFSTDNGGAVFRAGSNYPLRGTKGTLFEGGTHGVGFVAGGYLKRKGIVHKELFHITDWYPTLLSAASFGKERSNDVDGVDQWKSIRLGKKTKRKTMVYNLQIDPVAGAIRVGPYKLMFAPKGKLQKQLERIRNFLSAF